MRTDRLLSPGGRGRAPRARSEKEGWASWPERNASPQASVSPTSFCAAIPWWYDLSCEGARLTLEIAPNEDATGTFTVAAHARQSPEHPVITEPGPTRAEALRAVGRAWAAKSGAFGFPTIDWELVGQALLAVRAIEDSYLKAGAR
jgi:hypothetical protein